MKHTAGFDLTVDCKRLRTSSPQHEWPRAWSGQAAPYVVTVLIMVLHRAWQVGIHHEDLDSAIQTYQLLSERWFTHASPTLFNAGTPRPQMSSCFLICMKVRRLPQTLTLADHRPRVDGQCHSEDLVDLSQGWPSASLPETCWHKRQHMFDSGPMHFPLTYGPCARQNDSIEGIYDTLKECAAISKSAGGIGVSIHNIRATVCPHSVYTIALRRLLPALTWTHKPLTPSYPDQMWIMINLSAKSLPCELLTLVCGARLAG